LINGAPWKQLPQLSSVLSQPHATLPRMAANIDVTCPKCGQTAGLRFDPGVEDAAPDLARQQLERECPDHEGKTWTFWHQI
jgi:hypothetical protein